MKYPSTVAVMSREIVVVIFRRKREKKEKRKRYHKIKIESYGPAFRGIARAKKEKKRITGKIGKEQQQREREKESEETTRRSQL